VVVEFWGVLLPHPQTASSSASSARIASFFMHLPLMDDPSENREMQAETSMDASGRASGRNRPARLLRGERPHLRIPRVCRAKPRISKAIDIPTKKPLQKCEKLPWVQSRNMRPKDKANTPPAANKFLC
jgi:hypothetical protein